MSRFWAADPRQVFPVDDHAAAVEPFEAGEHPQRRRLPATGGPEKGEELPRLDGQREPVEGSRAAEYPLQPVELDPGAGGH